MKILRNGSALACLSLLFARGPVPALAQDAREEARQAMNKYWNCLDRIHKSGRDKDAVRRHLFWTNGGLAAVCRDKAGPSDPKRAAYSLVSLVNEGGTAGMRRFRFNGPAGVRTQVGAKALKTVVGEGTLTVQYSCQPSELSYDDGRSGPVVATPFGTGSIEAISPTDGEGAPGGVLRNCITDIMREMGGDLKYDVLKACQDIGDPEISKVIAPFAQARLNSIPAGKGTVGTESNRAE